jgi:hypothetical protein
LQGVAHPHEIELNQYSSAQYVSVDGSILPYIPTANVNAPIIMVAEKIADRIRGRQPLARENLSPKN